MKGFKGYFAAVMATLMLAGCSGPAASVSSSGSAAPTPAADPFPTQVTIPADSDYVDFSSDRSTVFFNTTGNYNQTIFFDFFYPFDTSLKLNHYDALTKYQLEHETYQDNGTVMVALEDIVKLYAPYFTYGIENELLTVRHILVTKTVHPEDSGLRSPSLNYVKTVWEATFPLGKTGDVSVNRITYAPFTTTAANGAVEGLAEVAMEKTEAVANKALATPIAMKDGQIYVPVSDFMSALEKVILTDGHYLGVQTTIPNIPKSSATNQYTGGEKLGNANMTWADYMDGVLEGTIAKGHLWNSFYMGTETLFTGEGYDGDSDPTQQVTINRIIPYNVYIPQSYDPTVPNKLNFMLHGGTGNENAPFERESDRDMDIEPIADKHGYIVLSPNAWTRGPQWYKGAARYSFLKSFEMVCKDYNVDLDKVFLSGNSAGGMGTWDLSIRYPEMFVATSAQAPASTMKKLTDEQKVIYAEKIGNIPTLFMHGTADVTIPYDSRFVPWLETGVKDILKNAYYVVVEEGHHSYAYGSCMEMMYTFFDRQLEGAKPQNHSFTTLKFTDNSSEAKLDNTSYTMANAAQTKDGVITVALSDLSKICGPDFYVYNISAYNTDPAKTANTITILYQNTTVNLTLNDSGIRLNAELYSKDIPTDKVDSTYVDESPVKDYVVDDRKLSVSPYEDHGEIYVPAAEFLSLFGISVD